MNIFKKRPCDHTKNAIYQKFKLEDGTLMIDHECLDCHYHETYHVYGEEDNWHETICVKNSKTIK